MRILIATLLTMTSLTAGAVGKTEKVYTCELAISAEGVPQGAASVTFEIPEKAPEGHGGSYRTFAFGPHKVSVQADGKWRSVYWTKGSEPLADIVTAGANPFGPHHAVLVFDPKDREQMVSLSCSVKQ